MGSTSGKSVTNNESYLVDTHFGFLGNLPDPCRKTAGKIVGKTVFETFWSDKLNEWMPKKILDDPDKINDTALVDNTEQKA